MISGKRRKEGQLKEKDMREGYCKGGRKKRVREGKGDVKKGGEDERKE